MQALTAPIRRPWIGVAMAGALAVAWRLPFVRLPITTDEAGYVTVARLWAHGARLYRGAWVDRPQGLLLVFRVLARFGGSLAVLRVAAVIAGVVLVLLVAAAANELGGRRIAGAAALIAGALGCSPFLESFTLSGELLAALPSVACAYCALRWLNAERTRWLVGAGLLCGCAVLVKQSAFDSGLALALLIAMRPGRAKPLAVLLGAAAVPVLVAVATAPSARDWWAAVVAYRFHGADVVAGVSSVGWSDVAAAALPIAKGLGPLLLVAALGFRRSPLYVRVWIVTAAVGAVGGGLFHAHYFIELVPPLSLAAAYGLVSRARLTIATAAVAVSVATVIPAVDAPTPRQVDLIFPRDQHLAYDASVARDVARASRAASTILVLPPTASIGYLAHRRSAIPYLWARNVETSKSAARAEREAILRRRPSMIVVEQQPGFLHAVGLTLAEIRRHYVPMFTAHGFTVYRLRG